jgi:predicted MFS family arabinose efflux permease
VKRVLVWAAFLYGAGCALAALAPDMAVLLAARLVQGVAGGTLISLSYVATEQFFAERLWGRLFGVVAAIWGAGALLGPLIGGVFADLGVWRFAFWAFALQAAILFAMALILLPADAGARSPSGRWPLAPLIALFVATLLVAQAGIDTRIWVSLAECLAGIALLYMAARLDRRSSSRLLPLRSLDLGHPMGMGMLMVFALSAATTGFRAYGPLILKIMFGTDPLISGYILAGEAIAWSLATLLVSGITVTHAAGLIRIGAALVAIGAAAFAVAVPLGSLSLMVVCALFEGLGFGMCWPSLVHRAVRHAEADEKGLAAAAPGVVQRIGYAVGAAASGLAANMSGLADGISVEAAKVAGFWVFAGFVPVLLIGWIAAWRFAGASDQR